MRYNPRIVPLAMALLGCATGASAQNPLGAEFQVNTVTIGQQQYPRIAMDASGRFTIVWQDQVGPSRIAGRRYLSSGNAVGNDFDVSTLAGTTNRTPDIASALSGNMVVVWTEGYDGHSFGVRSRGLSSTGAAGTDFRVNVHTAGKQYEPAVAVVPTTGSALAVWSSDSASGTSSPTLLARPINPGGEPVGAEFIVPATTAYPRFPAIAYLPGPSLYVVAWDARDGIVRKIQARRVSTSAGVGGEISVSDGTNITPTAPAVASDAAGNFVVVWEQITPHELRYRRFDSSGNALGASTAINATTAASAPRIAMTDQGDFIVVWGSGSTIAGMRFAANGTPVGAEFQINTLAGTKSGPSIALRGTNDFVVTWNFGDGNLNGVFARRFGGLRAAGLAVDGNGVWDRNEAGGLTPSWTNLTGSSQGPLTGTLSALSCPAGFSCWINDDTASYTVPANQTAPCTSGPCYQVENTAGIGAPTGHQDATALETLGTGELKTWKLHIGESFTDVPKTSSEYRYVETVLHRAITGGCGSGIYCPNNSSTREQMPVFVLAAKEGAGYAPPPCTTAPFNDVPVGSPFCRWIKELVTRGVVSGCGGGNYCPTQAVSREQMMLFALRTFDPTLNPPACTTKPYPDVETTNPFCPWIQAAAARGIVIGGCTAPNFCPFDPILRGHMAAVIAQAFSLTLYGL